MGPNRQADMSLDDIIWEFSLNETLDIVSQLSLPEILIVAANPRSKKPRPHSEILALSNAADEKLEELKSVRTVILDALVKDLGIPGDMETHRATDYFGKYEFATRLASEIPVRQELTSSVLDDIQYYNELIAAWKSGRKSPSQASRGQWLRNTSINLSFRYYHAYVEGSPQVIAIKTKSDERISSKIPYKMIEEGRRLNGGTFLQERDIRKRVPLSAGVIRDIAGLQFVTQDKDMFSDGSYIGRIKHFLAQSPSIEVGELEVHNDDPSSNKFYQAIHLTVGYNGVPNAGTMLTSHSNVAEVILMQYPYFLSANFGPNGYWRRMNDQERGIVDYHLNPRNRRFITKFTSAELAWKSEMEDRIRKVLTFARK